MKKQLNVDQITSELTGGSAFFPGYKKNDSAAVPKKEEETPPPPKPEPVTPTPTTPVRTVSPAPQVTQGAKTTNEQQVKQEKFEKYSTYLRPGYKKELKIIALEKDCKDYEVLDEAITLYLKSRPNK